MSGFFSLSAYQPKGVPVGRDDDQAILPGQFAKPVPGVIFPGRIPVPGAVQQVEHGGKRSETPGLTGTKALKRVTFFRVLETSVTVSSRQSIIRDFSGTLGGAGWGGIITAGLKGLDNRRRQIRSRSRGRGWTGPGEDRYRCPQWRWFVALSRSRRTGAALRSAAPQMARGNDPDNKSN